MKIIRKLAEFEDGTEYEELLLIRVGRRFGTVVRHGAIVQGRRSNIVNYDFGLSVRIKGRHQKALTQSRSFEV